MTQAISEQTLQQLFVRPYGSLTIQRPIKHFAKAIGLVPRVPGEPNSDTLAKIYTNHRSHEAMVRSSFKSDTDHHNFENLVRGRNKTKDEIRGQLARQLGVTEDILMQMVHGRQDGPLLPQLLDIFNMTEGFFSWIFNKALEGFVPCPHCGNNELDDTVEFWSTLPDGQMNEPEYLFVERLLGAIMGWRLICALLAKDSSSHGDGFIGLPLDPADPGQHPVGNWLQVVRHAYGCADNLALQNRLADLPEKRRPLRPVTQFRLNKWACGEGLVPTDLGKSLVKGLKNSSALEFALLEARALTFIQEFVTASILGDHPPKKEMVRNLIYKRIQDMNHKLELNLKRLSQEKSLGSDPRCES